MLPVILIQSKYDNSQRQQHGMYSSECSLLTFITTCRIMIVPSCCHVHANNLQILSENQFSRQHVPLLSTELYRVYIGKPDSPIMTYNNQSVFVIVLTLG